MMEPVFTADGQTYEKKDIEQWLENHDTSLLTGDKLANKTLVPNFALRQLIHELLEAHPELLDQHLSEAEARERRRFVDAASLDDWPKVVQMIDEVGVDIDLLADTGTGDPDTGLRRRRGGRGRPPSTSSTCAPAPAREGRQPQPRQHDGRPRSLMEASAQGCRSLVPRRVEHNAPTSSTRSTSPRPSPAGPATATPSASSDPRRLRQVVRARNGKLGAAGGDGLRPHGRGRPAQGAGEGEAGGAYHDEPFQLARRRRQPRRRGTPARASRPAASTRT